MPNGPEIKRRKFLEGTGATTLAAVAGCLGGTGATTDTETPKQKDEDEQDNDTNTTPTELQNILQHTPYGGSHPGNNRLYANHPQNVLSALEGEYAEAWANHLHTSVYADAGIFGKPPEEHQGLNNNAIGMLVSDSDIDMDTKRSSLDKHGFKKQGEEAGAEIYRNGEFPHLYDSVEDSQPTTVIIGDKKDAIIDEDMKAVADLSVDELVSVTMNTLEYDEGGQERKPAAEQNPVAKALGDSYQPSVRMTAFSEPLDNGVQGYAFVHDPVPEDADREGVDVIAYELTQGGIEAVKTVNSEESNLGTDALTVSRPSTLGL